MPGNKLFRENRGVAYILYSIYAFRQLVLLLLAPDVTAIHGVMTMLNGHAL